MLEGSIHRLDPVTLQTLETYELKDLLPDEVYAVASLSGCSDNNRLVVHATTAGTYQGNAYVVDMERKTVVVKKEASLFSDKASISPDGHTIRIEDKLYTEQRDGTWQQLDRYAYELGKFIFHPTKPLFYTTHGTRIVFYSTANGTQQHTLQPEIELYDCEIDAGSGYLYGHRDNVLYIYNIETSQLLRKLDLVSSAKVFLYKNRIFSKDRYIAL